jgi:hypothetical protein
VKDHIVVLNCKYFSCKHAMHLQCLFVSPPGFLVYNHLPCPTVNPAFNILPLNYSKVIGRCFVELTFAHVISNNTFLKCSVEATKYCSLSDGVEFVQVNGHQMAGRNNLLPVSSGRIFFRLYNVDHGFFESSGVFSLKTTRDPDSHMSSSICIIDATNGNKLTILFSELVSDPSNPHAGISMFAMDLIQYEIQNVTTGTDARLQFMQNNSMSIPHDFRASFYRSSVPSDSARMPPRVSVDTASQFNLASGPHSMSPFGNASKKNSRPIKQASLLNRVPPSITPNFPTDSSKADFTLENIAGSYMYMYLYAIIINIALSYFIVHSWNLQVVCVLFPGPKLVASIFSKLFPPEKMVLSH